MGKQDNIAATQKFGEAANSGNFALFHEVVAPNSVDHDPAPGQGTGPEGFTQFFTMLRSAFPDLNIAVEYMAADDNNVHDDGHPSRRFYGRSGNRQAR